METSTYIDICEKLFKDYGPVKSYVIFSNGSVVIFQDSQNNAAADLQTINVDAIKTMINFKNSNSGNDVNVMKVNGK